MTTQPQPVAPEPAPDESLELSVAAHLTDLALDNPAQDPARLTFGVVRTGMDLVELITEHGAVFEVQDAGGSTITWQTAARMQVSAYAASYSDVQAAARAADRFLLQPKPPTPDGALRIDSWRCESRWVTGWYPELHVLVSTWRITTRAWP